MLEQLSEVFEFLWGGPLFIIVIGIGLYFSVRLKFFQILNLQSIYINTIGTIAGKNRKNTLGEAASKKSLKSIEVAATVLSGTLGAGTIAGVAAAIAIGGPGAIFWMWLIAIVGMMTKMAEVTLAVRYRMKGENGEYYGGPMHYIKKGLAKKWHPLASLYAVALMILVITDACFVQTNTMAAVINYTFGIPPFAVGCFIVVVGGIIIFKGLSSLGKFCTFALPPITIAYFIGTAWVVISHIETVPHVVATIFHYAFAPAPATGGFVGSTILMAISKGASRGIFTNEAGMGTSATVHATANVDYAFRQGMWGAVEVFFVSMITCNFTAFAILASGIWTNPDYQGIQIVFAALKETWHPLIVQFLCLGVALILFASYLGSYIKFRTSINYLFGDKLEKMIKWIYFVPPLIAVGMEIPVIWLMADIAVGFLVIPNVIALFLLRKDFFAEFEKFREYAKRQVNLCNSNSAEQDRPEK
ncbi:TPA: sodium:alanine symporter family protein [Kluyvera intermedia]|uniref:Amino acid:proton symporter n=2 Tax=Enterobacteriaceae TaxID=543 RepID=A0AAC8QPX1_9ENTR|nr:amino acid:proton symporter [Phytobacter ursingii]HAT2207706.1 sodium:alanine symporter family protein [Kluyvera intermedia]HAT2518391.1 sodium:alanine symporter family protein [Kluyvera intermedia]HAT2606515.1 sodium:alanine symporter family protein [Kluyvera intermedia]HAT2683283.1 sodium:alanine symporter family protein [Kluyvera intermedia]